MYYVYILKSLIDGAYYRGRTSDLDRRLSEHQSGQTSSNRSRRPFMLVHVELLENIEAAKQTELYFKSGVGREIIKEIDRAI